VGKFRFLATLSIAVLVFSLVALIRPAKTSAAADTCTWTGATNGNWSTGSNWTGCDNGGVPQDGDSLSFPSDASNLTMNNDLLITVATVSFFGDGYSVSGNSLHLSGDLNMYGASTIATSLVFTSSTAGSRTLNYQNSGAVLPSMISLGLTNGAGIQLFSTVSSLPMPRFSGQASNISIVGAATGGQRTFIATASNGWNVTVSGAITIARATVLCQVSDCLGGGNVINIYNGNSQGAELNLFSDNVIMDNDITLNSLGFDGPPTISASGANAELRGSITVTTTANFRVDSGKSLLLGNGSGTLFLGSGATAVMLGSSGENISIQDDLMGVGTLNVVGAHVTNTGDSSAYSGNIIVDPDGIYTGTSIGTSAGVTNVNDGGAWTLTNGTDTVIGDHVSLEGAGNSTVNAALDAQGQAVTFTDNVTTTNATINNTSAAGKTVTFADTIDGADGLTLKRTSGSINNSYVLSPTTDDSFTGDLHIIGAKATLNGTTLSVPHNLDIQANIGYDAQVIVSSAGQLSDTSAVSLTNGTAKTAYFTVNTPTVNVGDVTGNGTVNFQSTGRNLRLGNGDTSSTFNGTLAGSGNTITKVGSGTWTLGSGATVASGNAPTIVIQSGAVAFNSSIAAPVTVTAGSTLKGSGTIGDATIQSGATVNVGNSPGCMTMSSLSLASGSTFEEEIAGNTACSSYDQTTVTGTANLNGATLHVDLSYTPTTSTSFTILKAGSVLGTFNGLADGATLAVNGVNFRVHYTATAVILEYVSGGVPGAGSLANTGLPVGLLGGIAAGIIGIAMAVRLARQRKLYRLSR